MNATNDFVIKTPTMQAVEHRLGRDLGDALREMYIDRGLTQAAIATELNVQQAQVSRWMRDLKIPTRRLARLQASLV